MPLWMLEMKSDVGSLYECDQIQLKTRDRDLIQLIGFKICLHKSNGEGFERREMFAPRAPSVTPYGYS